MKQTHKLYYKRDALLLLKTLGIEVGADFHTLNTSKVAGLLEAADRERYQKPKNANGSRARYYHDRLQRHAQMKEG